jgi:hypothetical protein
LIILIAHRFKEFRVSPQSPLPLGEAWVAVARCIARSAELLARGRIHLPRSRVGDQLSFADGTSARVYRETVVDRPPAAEPTVLVVAFRLRGVRGVGHDLFRLESMLNTPLFVGFDGFVSKLWLANDDQGTYRGLYEWDSARLAEAYARALWRVLALVSVRGSIRYQIIPSMHRDELLQDPATVGAEGRDDWWRLITGPSALASQDRSRGMSAPEMESDLRKERS